MKPESGSSPAGEPELRRGQRLWTVIAALPYVIPVALLLSLVIAIILIAIGGYVYKWGWTGFAGKTLWDWMKLLLVRLLLGVGGFLITQMERRNSAREQELNSKRLEADRQQTQAQLRQTQQRLELDREQAEEDRLLTRVGQLTDRFTRAIDQLGATDDDGRRILERRIGAIYALERISQESQEDYTPIMEILTAYVREHAPWPPRFERAAQEPMFPDQDIQAILTVLRRRAEDHLPGPLRVSLDLRRTDLRGANLAFANLQGAILSETNLYTADLYRANLEESRLDGANLEGTRLDGANLEGAHLVRARFKGASLSDTNLKGATLLDANLEGAALIGADTQEANLTGAKGIAIEELEQQAASLEGATMPNGQKYEEWLKDIEKRQQDE